LGTIDAVIDVVKGRQQLFENCPFPGENYSSRAGVMNELRSSDLFWSLFNFSYQFILI
jgi:hypothetical protein